MFTYLYSLCLLILTSHIPLGWVNLAGVKKAGCVRLRWVAGKTVIPYGK